MRKYRYTFDEYLKAQRSHEKTKFRTVNRAANRKHDIKTIKEKLPNAKHILCVGCRDVSEINDFEKEGFEVVGIDLFSSDDSKIRVMDMHEIIHNFSAFQFDLVYMSHSLEHSYHPEKVLKGVQEISKMGLYVVLPKQKEPTAKDPTVLDCMKTPNVDSVKKTFDRFFDIDFEVDYFYNRQGSGEFENDIAFLLRFVSVEPVENDVASTIKLIETK